MDLSDNTDWVSFCKYLSVFSSCCGCQTLAAITRLFEINFSTSLSLSVHVELGSHKTVAQPCSFEKMGVLVAKTGAWRAEGGNKSSVLISVKYFSCLIACH